MRAMGAHCRFVHCADLHLGSRFKGVAARDPAEAERMTESVFASFSRIVDMAIDEGADFMVIAGDAFDEDTITPSTRHRFASELGRLGIPCYIVRGNHDPRTDWESSIPYPDNVHEFGTEPEHIRPEGLDGVEVVGVSFADWHEERNLPSLIRGTEGMFTVACVHCDVDSAGGEYAYSPCRLSDLMGRGVDYWALGHVHKRAVLSERPHVVYPGNIQGRKIKETGEKGAYLVTVADGAVTGFEFRPTQGILWSKVTVDVTGKDVGAVMEELSGRIHKGDIVRITLTGSGPLDSMARLQPGDLSDMISKRLGCTVAGIVAETTPEIDLESRAGGADMTAKVIQAGESLKSAGREEILRRIKSNKIAREHAEFFESMDDEELRDLADRAMRMLVARLEGSS